MKNFTERPVDIEFYLNYTNSIGLLYERRTIYTSNLHRLLLIIVLYNSIFKNNFPIREANKNVILLSKNRIYDSATKMYAVYIFFKTICHYNGCIYYWDTGWARFCVVIDINAVIGFIPADRIDIAVFSFIPMKCYANHGIVIIIDSVYKEALQTIWSSLFSS